MPPGLLFVSSFFFFNVALAIQDFFVVPYKFYDCFSSSVKNSVGILIEIALNM